MTRPLSPQRPIPELPHTAFTHAFYLTNSSVTSLHDNEDLVNCLNNTIAQQNKRYSILMIVVIYKKAFLKA